MGQDEPMKATTKKLPVSLSYSDFEAKTKEFLVPAADAGFGSFRGLKSGSIYPFGALSYLGTEITANDVFARLVDSGQKIRNVDETLKVLDAYLQMLQEFRIGNILAVEPCVESPSGFRLKKIANSPPVKRVNLP